MVMLMISNCVVYYSGPSECTARFLIFGGLFVIRETEKGRRFEFGGMFPVVSSLIFYDIHIGILYALQFINFYPILLNC